jgi:hypothetical protein
MPVGGLLGEARLHTGLRSAIRKLPKNEPAEMIGAAAKKSLELPSF